jgi:hypothetical protein
MPDLTCRLSGAVPLAVLLAGAVVVPGAMVSMSAAEQDPVTAAKIDPPLHDALRSGQSARVFVVGRTQLFAPVGGLEAFQRAHGADDRRALRRYVVETLERNAAAEQVAWHVRHLNAPRVWSEPGNVGEMSPNVLNTSSGRQHGTMVPGIVLGDGTGGIDTLGLLAPFSSMGPAEWGTVALYGDYPMPTGLVKPDLVAFPGEGYPVLGTGESGYIDTDTLQIRGNSFSGPQVAGIAALILSEQPSMSVWQVREIIERSAQDLGPPGKDNEFGHGLADAYAAVLLARRLGTAGDPDNTARGRE